MADEPEGQSVHIQLDVDAAQANPSDRQPGGERSARLTVTIGLGAIALVALLVFMARSPRSSAPDGDSASSTTTATVRSQETGAGVGSTSTTVAAAPSIFVPTVGISYLLSVLPDEIGYLGLGIDEMSNGAPNILRSVDGVSWVPVNTVLGNSVAPPQDRSRQNRSFEELIRLDDGFAVLLSTSIYDETTGAESDVRIERLISLDGTRWEADPSFDPVEIEADWSTQVFAHGRDSFVYLVDSRVNRPLQRLIVDQLVDTENIDACWMGGSNREGLMLISLCKSGEQVTIEPDDLVDPERFDDLGRCALLLGTIGSSSANFWIASRESTSVQFGPGHFLAPPIVTADHTVVSVDRGLPPWLDPSSCDGFIEVPESLPAAVVLWDPSNPSELTRHPTRTDDSLAGFPSAEPTMWGRKLLFDNQSVIQSVDIDTGEWADVLKLLEPIEFRGRFSEAGSSLVQIDRGGLLITDVRTGDQMLLEDDSEVSSNGAAVVYADDDIALVWDGSSTFFVELPAQ